MLGSDIEYPLWSNALSAKSVLGGRVALTFIWLVQHSLDAGCVYLNNKVFDLRDMGLEMP